MKPPLRLVDHPAIPRDLRAELKEAMERDPPYDAAAGLARLRMALRSEDSASFRGEAPVSGGPTRQLQTNADAGTPLGALASPATREEVPVVEQSGVMAGPNATAGGSPRRPGKDPLGAEQSGVVARSDAPGGASKQQGRPPEGGRSGARSR